MSLPPLPTFHLWTHTTVPESTWLEYKENIPKETEGIRKMEATVCGFLNTNGGYMVYGVRDIDGALVGVQATGKLYDRFMLSIDSIFHSRTIINEAFPSDPIPYSCIQTSTVTTREKKILLVITVTPPPSSSSSTSFGRFVARGIVWHRLNASNYRETTDSIYQKTLALTTERDNLKRKLEATRKEFALVAKASKTIEYQKMKIEEELHAREDSLTELENEISTMKEELSVSEKARNELEEQLAEMREALWLAKTERDSAFSFSTTKKEIDSERDSWLSFLLCS